MAGSRFCSAAQAATAVVEVRDLRYGLLNALLDEMQLMRLFTGDLEDCQYDDECVKSVRTMLNEAHACSAPQAA